MDIFSNRLSKNLRDVLEDNINSLSRQLATTKAADYAAYSQRVGFIQGLSKALEHLTEIEKNLGRAEDDGERAPMKSGRYED